MRETLALLDVVGPYSTEDEQPHHGTNHGPRLKTSTRRAADVLPAQHFGSGTLIVGPCGANSHSDGSTRPVPLRGENDQSWASATGADTSWPAESLPDLQIGRSTDLEQIDSLIEVEGLLHG